MKYLFAVLSSALLVVASAISIDVKAQDFLEPDDRFMGKGNHDEYAYELKQYLFPEEWSIGYLSVPSFSGEYGIFLLYDSNGPMLVYNRFRSNYFYYMVSKNKNNTQINISSDTVRISTEEADHLTGIITDAIDKAVKPEGLGRLGLDGTNHYFMLPDKMAKIWSPVKDSECDKLVKKFEKLRELFPEVHFGGYSYYNPDKSLSVSFIGYENSIIIGEFHDVFNLFNGLNLLIELQKQSFRFALNGSALWGRLLSSDFYYDSDNNYNWNTDRFVNKVQIRLGIGYTFFANHNINLTPVAGVSFSRMSQDTTEKDIKNKKIISSTSLVGGYYLGIETDWHLKKVLFPFFDTDQALRFQLFTSNHHYDNVGSIWSLNFGISYIFTNYEFFY